jgi:hypothetical protein
LYGDGNEPERPSGDDVDGGYHTFPTDDWSGPQSQSGKTSSGNKHGPMDDDDDDDDDDDASTAAASSSSGRSSNPSSGGPSGGSGPGGKFGSSGGAMRASGKQVLSATPLLAAQQQQQHASGGLGGVTKLAADVYALPSLRPGRAYAAAGSTSATVVSAAALSASYYEALSGLARTSAQYAAQASEAARAGAPADRASLFASSGGRGLHGQTAAKPTAARDVTLHPALTAAATLSAFVVGLIATKVVG